MSADRCCSVSVADAGDRTFAAQSTGDRATPPTFLRRCLDIAEWMIPGAILALLPKCPLCLAAYIALVTGVGLSMSTLMHLRTTMMILCAASLIYLVVRSIWRTSQLKNRPLG